MRDYSAWGINPPPSAVPELARLSDTDTEPFSVVAVSLNRELQKIILSHGPFLARAFQEAHPQHNPDRAMFAMLQPLMVVLFGEWLVGYQRQLLGKKIDTQSLAGIDMEACVRAFAQFAADCVSHLVQSGMPPAGKPQ